MKIIAHLKMAVCTLALGCSLLIAVALVSPAYQNPHIEEKDRASQAFELQAPIGINKNLWRQRIPPDNPITKKKVALGQSLFFNKRLSADGTISCATCHDPSTAFAGKDPIALGAKSHVGTRNAPTLLNTAFSESYFWDGRALTLEEQAKQPLLNPTEMGMINQAELVQRVSSIPEYRKRFRHIFRREGITLNTIVKAIAAYERTLVSRNSPFDRFISGDKNAMTTSQMKGWKLFGGKAKCIECHTFSSSSPFFTDSKFYNTGIATRDQNFSELLCHANEVSLSNKDEILDSGSLAHRPGFSELGRFLVTRKDKDIAAFKTPTLRDVELTGPYMHNGSLKTLIDVVRFYNQGGQKNPNLDDKMSPLSLDEIEINQIVDFLKALTSDDVLRRAQSARPQTRTPVTLPQLRARNKRILNQ